MTDQTTFSRHYGRVAKELGLPQGGVAAVAQLTADGATIPFIARYRKELTGSLDEVAVLSIRERLQELAELDKRRDTILASLTERGLLEPELEKSIRAAESMASLEDAYLPYRPKRRTRAAMAREKGLGPLAEKIFVQRGIDVRAEAGKYVDPEKGVEDVEAALAGARDVMAEMIGENSEVRRAMRGLFRSRGRFVSRVAKGKESEGAVYRDWFDWQGPVGKIMSHRVLAMFRGEREGFLSLSLRPQAEEGEALALRLSVRGKGPDSRQVAEAAADAYARLIAPSMENELRAEVKKKADQEAIAVFAKNLRGLLLAPPLGQKSVLALDPGFRTGAKLAVVGPQGGLLHHETIFPLGSQHQAAQAAGIVKKLCAEYGVDAIAVGNGTAGRETEAFVRGLVSGVAVAMVNEAGASVYSASEVARREFPDLDLTVRGAVSIARRLADPLAELVKIDPKSIGVGQYQHDVDQAALKRALDEVVESCVGLVGVEVNTASPELLAYVPGLGPALAANVVAHREENGPFASRRELLKVKRLGPKAFEQCAGFLRVRGKNPLDASAVHPERYALVQRMARDAGVGVAELMADATLREGIDLSKYVGGDVGLPTLRDIVEELAKPGRDPREKFSPFAFAEGVREIGDLEPGMVLPGIVTNVTGFGAFVDVGVHRDGLVHISQLADRYVQSPSEVVQVGDEVTVTVTEIDMARKRIGLSMKANTQAGGRG